MGFPLWCGYDVIDDLIGTVDLHITERYENGKRLWIIMTFKEHLKGLNQVKCLNIKKWTNIIFLLQVITNFTLMPGETRVTI